jgi:hypothetical protein
MNLDLLVEMELNRWDWSNIMMCGGPATNIPLAIRELLSAETGDEAEEAYWKLENFIVVQGNIFEAAAYSIPVLMAALVKTDRPGPVQVSLFELLYQILGGEVHADEIARGMHDLKERCVASARVGLWVLYPYYQAFQGDLRRYLKCIILTLENDMYRLNYLDDHLEKNESK